MSLKGTLYGFAGALLFVIGMLGTVIGIIGILLYGISFHFYEMIISLVVAFVMYNVMNLGVSCSDLGYYYS